MMTYQHVILAVVAVLLVAGYTNAEVVEFVDCPVSADEPNYGNNCTIHEVRVTPCAEAANKEPCKIKRGKSASIEFDYTPNYPSETLVGKAFWTTAVADLPFVGMNIDACTYTTCPLQANHKQSYIYQLAISKKFPVRTFDVKWRLYNDVNMECCFITKIKLVK